MKKFDFIWVTIGKIFTHNFYFILLLLLFNFTTGALMNAERELGVSILTKWIHGFINAFLVSYFFGVIRECISSHRLKVLYTSSIIFLFGLLFVCECFPLYYYKSGFVPSVILPLLATNSQEASEFFQMYGGIYWLIGGILFLGIACIVAHKQFKRISSRYFSPLGKLVVLVLLAGIVAAIYRQQKAPLFKTMIPMQRLWVSQQIVREEMKSFREVAKQVKSDPVITENKSEIQDVVVILGESLGRKYMGIYDSTYPTTPLLEGLKDAGEIYLFRDVVSPYVSTIPVVQTLFSFYHYESTKEWNQYDLLVDIMKKAGYKTVWISNQESFGTYGNLPAAIAKRSDVVLFNHTRSSFEHRYGDFDGELLPLLDKELQNSTDKNFWVIHLMGSHGNYKHRYPNEYNRFGTKDIAWLDDPKAKEVAANYLNTILYNDYVVSEIIERFVKREAVVLYLSDHGEELFERRNFSGHAETDPSRYMAEIPFLIWCSISLREKEPRKVEQIREAVGQPYMTDDLMHTILDLTDIRTMDFDSTRSVIHPAFNPLRKRIVSKVDYEELRKEK